MLRGADPTGEGDVRRPSRTGIRLGAAAAVLVGLLALAALCPVPLPIGGGRVYCGPVCKRLFILGGVPVWEWGDFSIRATEWRPKS